MPENSSTAQSTSTDLARRAVAVLAISLATCGAVAAGIGLLDAGLGATVGGRAYLNRGIAVAIVGAIIAGVVNPRGPGEVRRLGIVAFGVWPFAAFALFIAWRIGVSEEQAAHCEAGDASECFTLARRRDKRGRVEEGRVLFDRGCALGHAASCATLGFRAPTGDMTEHDVDDYLDSACDGGVALACARLASRVAEFDPTRAGILRAAACEAGDASSCSEAE